MKLVISVISSLVAGLFLGASGFSPLMELQRLFEARKKVLWAIILGATAFVFGITAVIMASIEVALQYEAQGFLMWSAMLTLSAIFLTLGIICAASAKGVFPEPRLQSGFNLANLGDNQSAMQMLENLGKQLFTEPGAPFAHVFQTDTRSSEPPPSKAHAPAPEPHGAAGPQVSH